jgi:hypothetical protein
MKKLLFRLFGCDGQLGLDVQSRSKVPNWGFRRPIILILLG